MNTHCPTFPPSLAWARPFVAACLLLAGLLLTGCTTTGRDSLDERAILDFYHGRYDAARAHFEPKAAKPDEDYVLNNLRLGSINLADYDFKAAEGDFLNAYEVMNSTGVNDGGRGAGAALIHEGIKVWKGEPFERAMCSFYLGVIYYTRRDYNNARASFENALFKLRDYSSDDDEKSYTDVESDFAAAHLMLGRCWQKLGREDKAAASFALAARLRPEIKALADPALNEQANVLLIVDFGDGPVKTTEYDSSIVTFLPKPGQSVPLPRAQLQVDGKPVDIRGEDVPPVDLVVTAHDRKWQTIDTIRLTKSVVGTGLMAGGAARTVTARKEGHVWTGLGLMAAGALLKASGGADLRFWETLPRGTYIIPVRLPAGKHNLTVFFGTGNTLRQGLKGITATSDGESTYYLRVFQAGRPAIELE